MVSALDRWTQYLEATGASAATVGLRRRTVEALRRHAGVADAKDVTREHVVAFLGRPLSKWSRLTYWRGIRAWSAFLKDFDIDPDSDLLRGIPKPRVPAPVARPISDEALDRLLHLTLTPRADAYVRLALFAALRVHEIAKIRGEDFDVDAGWLMVTGKGGHTAPVPIHPEVLRLTEYMPEYGFWFPSPRCPSKPVRPEAVSATILSALQSIGCNATAHQLRDTAATKMQRTVKDIRVTQSMLRHQSIQSTQKYAGVSDSALQEAVLSLDWGAAEEEQPVTNVYRLRR